MKGWMKSFYFKLNTLKIIDLLYFPVGIGIMPPDKTKHQILTVAEVAELLRVHRTTVSRYAQSGELRSYLIGSRRLFKESDVWVFFEKQVDGGCVFRKEA
jgi:excisionase family DNA binding protein